MLPTAILKWVTAAPFVPFRVRMNSGRTFDIRHPEMVRVGMTHTFIFFFIGGPGGYHEQFEMIGNMLIESIAPLPAAQPAGPPSEPSAA